MWKVFNKKSNQDQAKAKPEAKPEGPILPAKSDLPKAAGKAKVSRAFAVFIKPLVSEKNSIAASDDIYAFAVQRSANKIEVAKAFKALYNVKPSSVRMMIMPEKQKRYGRISGTRGEWKKAIIRVPKGAKVDIYAGV